MNFLSLWALRFFKLDWYSALALIVSKIKVGPTGKTVGFRPLVYFWKKSYIWPENCVKQKNFTKKFQFFFNQKCTSFLEGEGIVEMFVDKGGRDQKCSKMCVLLLFPKKHFYWFKSLNVDKVVDKCFYWHYQTTFWFQLFIM